MDFMVGAFRIFLLYIIFTNIIRIIFTIVNRKKIIQRMEEAKKQQAKMAENESKPKTNQEDKVEEIEYITDPICKEKIDKDNAYILSEDGEMKYFCSWDCRQEYIDRKNKNIEVDDSQDINTNLESSKIDKNIQIEEVEYIRDPICKEKVDRDNAYILSEDGEKKYFCSWDCRQEYIDRKNKN